MFDNTKPFKCANPLVLLNEDSPYYPQVKNKYTNYLDFDTFKHRYCPKDESKISEFENNFNNLVKSGIIILARCRKCASCINNNRYIWTQRMLWETKKWNNLYFVTLTYDDKYLSYDIKHNMTLNVSDYQKFFKRLRKAGIIFKYLISGEYGPKNKRPHFHFLMMTNSTLGLTPFKKFKGNQLYLSPFLAQKWGMGFVSVEVVSDVNVVSYITLYSSKSNTFTETSKRNKYYFWKVKDAIINQDVNKYGDIDTYIEDLNTRYYEDRKPEFIRASQGFDKVLWNYDTTPSYLLKKISKNDKTVQSILEERKENNLKNIRNCPNVIDVIRENKIDDELKNYKKYSKKDLNYEKNR